MPLNTKPQLGSVGIVLRHTLLMERFGVLGFGGSGFGVRVRMLLKFQTNSKVWWSHTSSGT